MSRCFPYPPPCYVRKVASDEAALIESIKLQSERQQSKNDRKKDRSKHKKEKKNKKEKSKDKKERSKEDKKERSKEKKHKSKERGEKSVHSRDLKETKDLLKGTKVEGEQLERSGLTEEHGQPVWPHSPGYLSDGTQINHKRKRNASLLPDEGSKLGKIIRIKLGSSLSQQEDSSAGSEQTCSTSGRENSVDEKIHVNGCFTIAETAVAVKDPSLSKPNIKDPLSHLSNVVSLPPPRTRSPAESAYEVLFEKWVAPPLHLVQQTDDEDWLFGRTGKQDGQNTMTNKAFSSVPSCGRSSSLWPRGQYLADADVYSLPYTIPF